LYVQKGSSHNFSFALNIFNPHAHPLLTSLFDTLAQLQTTSLHTPAKPLTSFAIPSAFGSRDFCCCAPLTRFARQNSPFASPLLGPLCLGKFHPRVAFYPKKLQSLSSLDFQSFLDTVARLRTTSLRSLASLGKNGYGAALTSGCLPATLRFALVGSVLSNSKTLLASSLLRPHLLFGEETVLKRQFKFFLKSFAFQEEQALKSPARIFGFESSFHSSLFPSSPSPRGKTTNLQLPAQKSWPFICLKSNFAL